MLILDLQSLRVIVQVLEHIINGDHGLVVVEVFHVPLDALQAHISIEAIIMIAEEHDL